MSPQRAARPCSHPGCNTLVTNGSRCDAHVETFHDQGYRAWYRTDRWRAIRAAQLRREPWCAECKAAGRMTVATDVDHIQAHRGNEAAFYAGPLQSLCHSHHSVKTQREIREGA